MGSRNRFDKDRRVAPVQMQQVPTRSRADNRRSSGNPVRSKKTNKPSRSGFPDLRGSVTPGSMEPAASNVGEGIQMQIAERHRAGAGYPAGVKKPDYYPVESRTILPRQETVTNAGGVVQTVKNLGGGGTPIDMSRSFDSLLQGVGQQPFGGTQLPTAMGNPYAATYKQTAGFGEGTPDIGGMNGATYDSEGGRNALNATNLQDMAPFYPGAPLIEGGSERISQQSTGISSSRLSDALEGVKTQEANREMTPERRQQMASMAFLNGDDSMSGLKARDAVNDVVYAGGQHYGRGALTEDGKLGDKYKIDRADARDIASGKQTAAGLLDVYKSRIKESAKSTTPVEAQEPLTIEKPGVKQSFGRTETITPGIDTSIPDTEAFNSNNGVDVPGFGKTGGYKSGMKRIDTSMTNPFG
jgi:hypothetical protein